MNFMALEYSLGTFLSISKGWNPRREWNIPSILREAILFESTLETARTLPSPRRISSPTPHLLLPTPHPPLPPTPSPWVKQVIITYHGLNLMNNLIHKLICLLMYKLMFTADRWMEGVKFVHQMLQTALLRLLRCTQNHELKMRS